MNVLKKIYDIREAHGWNEYRLSQEADIPQSTISSWYRKNAMPSIPVLEKVCKAFGMTISQFFAEEGEPVSLTVDQRALLDHWSTLDEKQKETLLALIQQM